MTLQNVIVIARHKMSAFELLERDAPLDIREGP